MTSLAFDASALWNKAKLLLDRALRARDVDDNVGYHLWATVSLELLGKGVLAHIHPALVADPSQFRSLLAACGGQLAPLPRTIPAKTLFERLKTVCQGFDDRMARECMTMTVRRNAELHSGESPIVGLDPRSWVPAFWKAAKVLADAQGHSLEDLVGKDEANRVEKILADSAATLSQTVLARVERRRREFGLAHPKDSQKRTDAERRAELRPAPTIYGTDEAYEMAYCPACGLPSWVLGSEWEREVMDTHWEQWAEDEYSRFQTVKITYGAEAFDCEECGLELYGHDELEVVELDISFEQEVEVEPEYEAEYGID